MRNFHLPGRSAAYAANGMAATSTPLSTLAALDVLRAGGNAVDAAVTASAVLCVSEPGSTGIGGDCFALVGLPDGRVLGLNGSGRAALAADADWLKASGLTRIDRQSVHCVTVPGAIDGWDRLLKAHGTWSLGQCLAPAIDLAEKGVPITPRVAFDWSLEAAVLAADEGGRMHYLKDGRAPRAGETMRYPALAATLRLIAAEGRDAFYEGSIAADMVGHLKARGSLLTHEDFARTAATWVSPISTSFAGHEILEIPPNGQGLTALIALNIGSGIVTPKTGIALQNRGSCFVAEPRHPNCIGPGKRPLHTIIPAMVRKDGRIAMSYGVMGGDYQPMGHVSVAVNRLIHGMDPQEAIDWPRYMPKAGTVVVEDGVAPALRTGLAGRGHRLVGTVKPLGGGQAIAIDWQEDLLIGGSDPRKDGLALGY
ncbi:MAG: gamma-glutamyltransferase [Rhizobiales bacterium]|nr:gamma-glutamyltransferase [Hyphomicrobiales bacterium]